MSDPKASLISLKNVNISITMSEDSYLLAFTRGTEPDSKKVQLKLPCTHITVNEVPVDNSPVKTVTGPSRFERHVQRNQKRNARAAKRARLKGSYPVPGAPKLKEWQVAEIKAILADKDLRNEHRSDYALFKELGSLYQVTGACINAIDKGVTWKNVGKAIKA